MSDDSANDSANSSKNVEPSIQSLASFWDRLAPEFNEYTRYYLSRNSWVQDRLNILFPGMDNLRIADIGTGCGFLAISYAQLGHIVTGTDISDGMLEQARSIADEKHLSIQFVKDDLVDTKLRRNYYDLVVVRDVLCEIDNYRRALKNMIDLVRPGGYIMVSDGNYFLYRHNSDYQKRHDYFLMKEGTHEYAGMLKIPDQVYDELAYLVGDLEINTLKRPFLELEYLLSLGLNNARVRYDDRDDYVRLTEDGPIRVALRYTLSLQKPYVDRYLIPDKGKNAKSYYFKDKANSSEIIGSQFQALANKDRIEIVKNLSKVAYTVTELADHVGLSVNKTSYHLNILKDAGFVRSVKEGRECRYSLIDESAIEYLINIASEAYRHS